MKPQTRLATLLSAGLLAGSAVLAGCAGDGTTAADPEPAGGQHGTAGGGGGKDTGTPAPSSEPTDGATGEVTVPVYFVGDTPHGPRLYREFRKVAAGDPAMAALDLLTSGDALDPDYRTLYPAGSFAGVTVGGGSIDVSLPDSGWTKPAAGMSTAEARLAAQQLVYTLQGVAQARVPVHVELDGQPAPLFGIDTGGGLTNAPEIDVRALVNLTSPEEGAAVSGSFTASGVASSFEATVPWELRQGDRVVKKGFSTAEGWMDKLYPWQTTVDVSDLSPGTYTFVAMTDDPSGGEGFGPTEDSRTIRVG